VKFGLKLWSTNADLIDEAVALVRSDVFQYVELTPIPGTSAVPFRKHDIPYIVHITTEGHGVNLADPSKAAFNRERIGECVLWADQLDADYLVLHPGFGRPDDAIPFLEGLTDHRIIIENMPRVGVHGEPMIGYDVAQVRRLAGDRFGLCLDINHAIKAAISLNRDYRAFVDEFLPLKPAVVHISDGHLDVEKDEHLHIGSGNYDFGFIADCLKKCGAQFVTLETPRESGLKDAVGDLERLLAGRH
jgi:sugar phosphate isomerase/epimerase